jgi:hypothetical protein
MTKEEVLNYLIATNIRLHGTIQSIEREPEWVNNVDVRDGIGNMTYGINENITRLYNILKKENNVS